MELYSEEFRADLISIWMDEMGLISNPAMRKQVKNYRAYFNAKDRRLKVSTQNKIPETPAQLHMAVMAAICGLKDAQPNMILRSVFQAGLDGFISMPHQAYCYDFISEWLHSDNIQQLYDMARYVEDEARLHQRFEKLTVEDFRVLMK